MGVHQEGKETMIDLRGKSKAEVENLIAELLEKGYDYVIKGHWLFYFELLIG